MRNLKNINNMILNIIASVIPTFVLQLFINPYLAKYLSTDEYGLMVTLISVINIIPVTLGNSLNNIRLLLRKKYEERNLYGDFNILFCGMMIVNIVLVMVMYFVYAKSFGQSILIIIMAVLFMFREYYTVLFLLEMNYFCVFISNILLTIGYIIGLFLVLCGMSWEYIYVIGYLISNIYIIVTTKLWKESFKKTELFSLTLKEEGQYLIACVLYRVTSYADKMIIYPILGGMQVTVYYIATILGKVLALIITPISNVILSNLSKRTSSEGKKEFKVVLKYGFIICFVGYWISVVVLPFVMSLLYPEYASEAQQYIYITTATAMISLMITMVNPYVLRYFETKWQVRLNIISVVVYLTFSIGGMMLFDLIGFCVGGCLASLCKLIVLIFVFFRAKMRTES